MSDAPSPSLAGASEADRDERTAICSALGCIDKPGIPLKFVQDLQRRLAESYARNDELIRTWDRASPTERQELDRMRRGWGPSSPTERVRRKTDVAACVQALGSALTELSVPEEDADDVPEEAQSYLDAAYDRVEKAYKEAIAVSHAIWDEPEEWPDIKAAEERGAAAAEARVAQLEADTARLAAALGCHIHADAYRESFPDNEQDAAHNRKSETWWRLMARCAVPQDDPLREVCSVAALSMPEVIAHRDAAIAKATAEHGA